MWRVTQPEARLLTEFDRELPEMATVRNSPHREQNNTACFIINVPILKPYISATTKSK